MRYLFLLLTVMTASAQRATVGFWNVENMFDTIPCPLYADDNDYTPAAKQGWNTARYQNKCTNIAGIIDRMNLDVVGIAEIENETVVRDLVKTLKTDYNYVHRTAGGKPRGRDIALLYKGDRFVPDSVRTVDSHTARSFLYVRGRLAGRRVDIVVCHLPSMLNRYEYRLRAMTRLFGFADSLHKADEGARLVILGDFNAAPRDKVVRHTACEEVLFCPLESAAAAGRGTYGHNGRWMMYDNIFMSVRLLPSFADAQIYTHPELLYDDPKLKRHGYPRRTFTNGRYTNGMSDHLPIFCVLKY